MSTRCTICESNCETIEANNTTYYVCTVCKFIFKNSDSLLASSEEKSRYDMHDNSIENTGYVEMFKRFIKAAVNPYAKDGKALDFGCGPGPVLMQLLEKLGFDVHGYDPFYSPKKVYEGEKYKLITCTETCEHFHDPLKEFRLMAQLLEDDGVISVQTEFKPSVDDFRDWYYIKDPTHVGFYDRKVFEKIADLTGLEVKYCDDKKYCVLARKH
jgi:hypothetical protein